MTGCDEPMARYFPLSFRRIAVAALVAIDGWSIQIPEVMSADTTPSAPTLQDAHQYFDSLISNNGVTALYETRSRSGDIMGYESFPVREYRRAGCLSGIVLNNGVKVDIDWTVIDRLQISDGTLSILYKQEVLFQFFHMLSVEGGILVEPSNSIPKLIFGINSELSRNRLSKAFSLLSSTCRSKSKFD